MGILATTYVPSAAEKAAIKVRCEARHREVQQIDELMQELVVRRYELSRACEIAESLLSPIRTLPEELLVEIFMRCMPDVSPKLLNGSVRGSRRRGSAYSDPKSHPHRVRGRLADVCQRWADVVDSTPAVWARLCLDQPLGDPDEVDDWLEKSKGTVLDIFIKPIRWFGVESEAETNATLELIRDRLARVRTLVIDAKGVASTIPSLLPVDTVTEAPTLRTLALEKVDHQHVSQEFGQLDAPNLQTLVLKCYDQFFTHLTEASLHSLRRFTVEVCDASSTSYLPVLSLCPNLEHLEWTDFDPPPEIDFELPPIVTLTSLKSLMYATEYSGEQSTQFFMCLQAPNLENFTFRAAEAGNRGYILDTVETFLREGAEKLRKLHLRNVDISGQRIEGLLSILPNLHSLVFSDESVIDPTLFASLCRPVLCPNLHTLELINTTHFPCGHLVNLIYSRTRLDGAPSTPGLISKISVTGGASNEVLMFLASERSETVKFNPGTRRGPGATYGVYEPVYTAWGGGSPIPNPIPNVDDEDEQWGDGWTPASPVLAHALPPGVPGAF